MPERLFMWDIKTFVISPVWQDSKWKFAEHICRRNFLWFGFGLEIMEIYFLTKFSGKAALDPLVEYFPVLWRKVMESCFRSEIFGIYFFGLREVEPREILPKKSFVFSFEGDFLTNEIWVGKNNKNFLEKYVRKFLIFVTDTSAFQDKYFSVLNKLVQS